MLGNTNTAQMFSHTIFVRHLSVIICVTKSVSDKFAFFMKFGVQKCSLKKMIRNPQFYSSLTNSNEFVLRTTLWSSTASAEILNGLHVKISLTIKLPNCTGAA
ncbi:hypothetical protein NQ317_004470 [Molorchus minor]|uniref:Uncharacterized protein n=1 Tax=Molorchus minor TaxID=1323400 RepID=A0ABQ9J5L0_9CUCU|nr:hypothetical protein NQ317_004470 [Molorchus minor]